MSIDWNIDINDYHQAHYASSSKLKDFASGGPRHYAMRHIQRTSLHESSDCKVFGQSLEDMLLEPEQWRAKYVVKPEELSLASNVGKAWRALIAGDFEQRFAVLPDGLTLAKKDGKAWRDENANGRTVVSANDYQSALALVPPGEGAREVIDADELASMEAMVASIRENDTAMALIRGARPQPTIRFDWPGLPGVQSRPDWLSLEGVPYTGFQAYSLDLKSTRHLSRIISGRDVAAFGYHAQAGLVAAALARNGVAECRTFLLAVEKCSPYRCQVVEVTHDWLSIGWGWCERQLEKLAAHYRTGDWPRVELEAVALPPPPPWASNDNSEENEAA